MTVKQVCLGAADGARHRVVGDTMRVLASWQDTGGAFEMFEMTAPRDSGQPPHAHPWIESYSLIEGSVDIRIGDRDVSAVAGCFVQIPPGEVHSYRITSDVARLIVVTSPNGASDFFREVDGVTDLPKVIGIAMRHGVTLPQPAPAT